MAAMPDFTGVDWASLPRAERLEALALFEEKLNRRGQELFFSIFPDEDTPWDGPPILQKLILPGQILYARHKYPKHLEYFRAGATFSERCAMMANRLGKTLTCGGFEMACHLTGLYPAWWEGRRFDHAISAWACGKINEKVREIVQPTLLGEVIGSGIAKTVDGRGIIPGRKIVGRPTWKAGIADQVDTVRVHHVSGEESLLAFKSYEQGRSGFEGTGQHVIWLDEEPPIDVYGEALIRTATTKGIMMLTFTPLEGLSDVVMQFLPEDQRPAA